MHGKRLADGEGLRKHLNSEKLQVMFRINKERDVI